MKHFQKTNHMPNFDYNLKVEQKKITFNFKLLRVNSKQLSIATTTKTTITTTGHLF